MRSALRKMGNSTGMIVPKAMLGQLGLSSGAAMELTIEGNRIIATPVEVAVRAEWADAAAAIGAVADDEADGWQAFGSDGDDALTW